MSEPQSRRSKEIGAQLKGTEVAVAAVIAARRDLRRAQTALLESGGWRGVKSAYDLQTTWCHPAGAAGLSRGTAVDLAMGVLEVDA